jgi:hypothetical protein
MPHDPGTSPFPARSQLARHTRSRAPGAPSPRRLLGPVADYKKDKAKAKAKDGAKDGAKGSGKEVPKEVDRSPLPGPVQRAALVLMELENCGSEVYRDILHDASKYHGLKFCGIDCDQRGRWHRNAKWRQQCRTLVRAWARV